MKKPNIRNVLAARYASTPMALLFGPERRVVLERQLWIATLKAQQSLGLAISDEAVRAYEAQVEKVDLESIKARELTLRQDVKARIEEFNALAGYELIHGGFTSRDLTDNTEQLQIRDALLLARDHTVAVLGRLARRIAEFSWLDLCGRSHNVPGQTVTLGKRIANWAEELLVAFSHLEWVIANYPLRGIKGAMGTQQDMIDLLGSPAKALELEELIRKHLGFARVLESTGQVYPRSLDFMVTSTLVQLASASGNFAKMVRLMAGHDLLHEGFKDGQTASTAMPHKFNSRTCERINGLVNVLCGFNDMVSRLVGDQWNEGDVSCSVVRRVALSDSFFAYDGICESGLHVLDEMQVFPGMVKRELTFYLPFLGSTRLLMAAVKMGVGRERAHALIKKHALAAVSRVREGEPNPLVQLLSDDSEYPLNRNEIESALSAPDHGASVEQAERIYVRIAEVMERYPAATTYVPEPML